MNTVGQLRERLVRCLNVLSMYDDKDRTINRADAERLVKLLKDGQHLVPCVKAWCVGYTYDPDKTFRPGEFAGFYGCETEEQAKELLKWFTLRCEVSHRGNTDQPSVLLTEIAVWNMVDPKADLKELTQNLFR